MHCDGMAGLASLRRLRDQGGVGSVFPLPSFLYPPVPFGLFAAEEN